eukprot:Hpha_TRINITY_DN7874_c0_g1::TRINITY_DN7874_c0_g1_i1::g.185547::m.185547
MIAGGEPGAGGWVQGSALCTRCGSVVEVCGTLQRRVEFDGMPGDEARRLVEQVCRQRDEVQRRVRELQDVLELRAGLTHTDAALWRQGPPALPAKLPLTDKKQTSASEQKGATAASASKAAAPAAAERGSGSAGKAGGPEGKEGKVPEAGGKAPVGGAPGGGGKSAAPVGGAPGGGASERRVRVERERRKDEDEPRRVAHEDRIKAPTVRSPPHTGPAHSAPAADRMRSPQRRPSKEQTAPRPLNPPPSKCEAEPVGGLVATTREQRQTIHKLQEETHRLTAELNTAALQRDELVRKLELAEAKARSSDAVAVLTGKELANARAQSDKDKALRDRNVSLNAEADSAAVRERAALTLLAQQENRTSELVRRVQELLIVTPSDQLRGLALGSPGDFEAWLAGAPRLKSTQIYAPPRRK